MFRATVTNRRTNPRNGGFSMIEMVIVVLVSSVMIQMAVSVSGPVLDRMAVKSASGSLMALHARARAHAIERGSVVQFRVDPIGDSAWISEGDQQIEVLRLGQESNIDLVGTVSVRLCLNPRGYADIECNSFSDSVEVGFERGTASAEILFLPLGQLIRQ